MIGRFEYGYGDEEERLDEAAVPAARLAAAAMLVAQSRRIDELVRGLEGVLEPELETRLEFARSCIAAIASPSVQFGDTCPDDGTQVRFDYALGTYCCLMGHCPPGS